MLSLGICSARSVVEVKPASMTVQVIGVMTNRPLGASTHPGRQS